MRYSGRIEYADARKMRVRNKTYYRFLHWPIWIWVFFLAPGPLTFNLFAHGFSAANSAWLAVVLIGTGIAGRSGQLPGVEPAPYILRFDEDRPNPLYRKVCYTFGWNAVLPSAYTQLLVRTVQPAGTANGWGGGVYEGTSKPTGIPSLNTAAMIMESALYKIRGRQIY